MQPESDAQLLRRYAEHGAEAAFTELVHRHTDLVYSAALRQVDSPQAAAEIAQSVFLGLARGAKSLSPRLAAEASLAGWLCRSARNLSLNFRRDEFRRHSRERQAMEQLASIPDAAPDWEHLRAVLDDAMSELSEPDYDALVLRFFNKLDLRAVGLALGVSEDTAQKRVSRALDKLRDHLVQRGASTGVAALSVVISANAVQAAPTGLVVTISTAALAGSAATASTIITAATKTVAMTTLQKTLVTATVAVLAGAGIYEARQAAQLRDQVQALQQQQTPMVEQLRELSEAFTEATNQVAALREDNERLNGNTSELVRLRSEVGMFRRRVTDNSDSTRQEAETTALVIVPPDTEEQQRQMELGKSLDGKNYVAQLGLFAKDNQGWLPTNWLQVASYSTKSPVSGTNLFEIVHLQPIHTDDLGTNISRTAVVRESTPWLTLQGGWAKVYGFADGHSEVIRPVFGDFETWERQHTFTP